MAKFTDHLTGDFDQIVQFIHEDLWQQSASISLEETYETTIDDKRIEQRVYERFSYTGGNRASLNVLFTETEDGADVCGIATGGSQAVFWKINTWGEAAFLETLESAVNRWKSNAGG
ncbi:MAG: hypothetical protein J5555_02600 [Firmicutes bacterium]|nr:hypothetical protein [Bacillota bacterium]